MKGKTKKLILAAVCAVVALALIVTAVIFMFARPGQKEEGNTGDGPKIELVKPIPTAYLGEPYDLKKVIVMEDGVSYSAKATYQNYDTMKETELSVTDLTFSQNEEFDVNVVITAEQDNKTSNKAVNIPVMVKADPIDELLQATWCDNGVTKLINSNSDFLKGENSHSSVSVTFNGQSTKGGSTVFIMHNRNIINSFTDTTWENAVLAFWVYNPMEKPIEFQLRVADSVTNFWTDWNANSFSRFAEPGKWTQILFSLRRYGVTHPLYNTGDAFALRMLYNGRPADGEEYSYSYYVDGLDVVPASQFPDLETTPLIPTGPIGSVKFDPKELLHSGVVRTWTIDENFGFEIVTDKTNNSKDALTIWAKEAVGWPRVGVVFSGSVDFSPYTSVMVDAKYVKNVWRWMEIELLYTGKDGKEMVAYCAAEFKGDDWKTVTFPLSQFKARSGDEINLKKVTGVRFVLNCDDGFDKGITNQYWFDNLRLSDEKNDTIDELLQATWSGDGVTKELNHKAEFLKGKGSNSSIAVTFKGKSANSGIQLFTMHNQNLINHFTDKTWANSALTFWVYNPMKEPLEFQLRVADSKTGFWTDWNANSISKFAEPGKWTQITFSLRRYGVTHPLYSKGDAFVLQMHYKGRPAVGKEYSYSCYVDGLDVVPASQFPDLDTTPLVPSQPSGPIAFNPDDILNSGVLRTWTFSDAFGFKVVTDKTNNSKDALNIWAREAVGWPRTGVIFSNSVDFSSYGNIMVDAMYGRNIWRWLEIELVYQADDGTEKVAYCAKEFKGDSWQTVAFPLSQFKERSGAAVNLKKVTGVRFVLNCDDGFDKGVTNQYWFDNLRLVKPTDPIDEILQTVWSADGVTKELNFKSDFLLKDKSSNSSIAVTFNGKSFNGGIQLFTMHNQTLINRFTDKTWENPVLTFWVYNPMEKPIEFQVRVVDTMTGFWSEWDTTDERKYAEPGKWTQITFALHRYGVSHALSNKHAWSDKNDAFVLQMQYDGQPAVGEEYSFSLYVDGTDVVPASQFPGLDTTPNLPSGNINFVPGEVMHSGVLSGWNFGGNSGYGFVSDVTNGSEDALTMWATEKVGYPSAGVKFTKSVDFSSYTAIKFDVKYARSKSVWLKIELLYQDADGTEKVVSSSKDIECGDGWQTVSFPLRDFKSATRAMIDLSKVTGIRFVVNFEDGFDPGITNQYWFDNLQLSKEIDEKEQMERDSDLLAQAEITRGAYLGPDHEAQYGVDGYSYDNNCDEVYGDQSLRSWKFSVEANKGKWGKAWLQLPEAKDMKDKFLVFDVKLDNAAGWMDLVLYESIDKKIGKWRSADHAGSLKDTIEWQTVTIDLSKLTELGNGDITKALYIVIGISDIPNGKPHSFIIDNMHLVTREEMKERESDLLAEATMEWGAYLGPDHKDRNGVEGYSYDNKCDEVYGKQSLRSWKFSVEAGKAVGWRTGQIRFNEAQDMTNKFLVFDLKMKNARRWLKLDFQDSSWKTVGTCRSDRNFVLQETEDWQRVVIDLSNMIDSQGGDISRVLLFTFGIDDGASVNKEEAQSFIIDNMHLVTREEMEAMEKESDMLAQATMYYGAYLGPDHADSKGLDGYSYDSNCNEVYGNQSFRSWKFSVEAGKAVGWRTGQIKFNEAQDMSNKFLVFDLKMKNARRWLKLDFQDSSWKTVGTCRSDRNFVLQETEDWQRVVIDLSKMIESQGGDISKVLLITFGIDEGASVNKEEDQSFIIDNMHLVDSVE